MKTLQRLTYGLVCGILAFGGVRAFAVAQTPAALDAPHVERASGLDTDVTVTYTLRPSAAPGRDGDPGPTVAGGSITIVSAGHTSSFSFEKLGIARAIAQVVPHDASDACGAAGPLAIAALPGAKAPAVVFTSVGFGKGCVPLVHTFVPVDDTSRAYTLVKTYDVAHPGPFTLAQSPDVRLHLDRVRSFAIPAGPSANVGRWTIAVLSGHTVDGKHLTIALDRPKNSEIPEADETLSLFDQAGVDVPGTVQLSDSHELQFQSQGK